MRKKNKFYIPTWNFSWSSDTENSNHCDKIMANIYSTMILCKMQKILVYYMHSVLNSLAAHTKDCAHGIQNVMQLVNQTKITVNVDNVSDLI